MKSLMFVFCLILCAPNLGFSDKAFYEMTEKEIDAFIRETHKKVPKAQERLILYSEKSLGTPYKLGPLGEGPKGKFDRDPLMRFDAFDCTTFVETTMALALARNLKKAKKILQKIRYKEGYISYETRNHFTEADWIPNNIEAGFIKDATADVGKEHVKYQVKIIHKNTWYENKQREDIPGFDQLDPAKSEELLAKFRDLSRMFPNEEHVYLGYIPLEELVGFGRQIPTGAIFSIVREDHLDKETMVSHQGFIIQKENGSYVRHAASSGQTEDRPLLEYFKRYEKSAWKVLGINLAMLNEPKA